MPTFNYVPRYLLRYAIEHSRHTWTPYETKQYDSIYALVADRCGITVPELHSYLDNNKDMMFSLFNSILAACGYMVSHFLFEDKYGDTNDWPFPVDTKK